jgi:hypothetical protein
MSEAFRMIEETARHNGTPDIVRELVDGSDGQLASGEPSVFLSG